MKKIVLLAAAVAMLAAMAMPAGAHPAEVGVFTGTAAVGKGGSCAQDGTGTVNGSGLGLPGVADNGKTGFWTLNTTIFGVPHSVPPLGSALRACGKLGPVQALGIGAHCGISRGFAGKGTVNVPGLGDHVHLLNLGWITSAGGTLPVTGNTANPGSKVKTGTVIALTQAQGGADCLNKGPGGDGAKGPGARNFTVVGAFAVVEGVIAPKAN